MIFGARIGSILISTFVAIVSRLVTCYAQASPHRCPDRGEQGGGQVVDRPERPGKLQMFQDAAN